MSILPLLSKVYERVIYEQASNYFEPFFNKTLFEFRKAHITQRALFKLLTCWFYYNGFVKSLDCLSHDLLLPKIQAYSFSKERIRLFLSYLTNRTQRIKIDSRFSDWTNILKGVSQGSIMDPLLFNILINVLFFFSAKCDIFNFADDNSLRSCGINLDNIFSNLTQNMQNLYEWFVCNPMKTNPDKFRFIILGNTGSHSFQIGGITVKLASSVTLLGITIDLKLNFSRTSQ